jgi:hypothetical protein
MPFLDPPGVFVQIFLVLQRDGRQQRFELAAILQLTDRRLTTADQHKRDPQEPGRSEPAAARSALMPCRKPSVERQL